MAASNLPEAVREQMLKGHQEGPVKTYIEYDVQDRVDKVYTAAVGVPNGGPCYVTQYGYVGTTTRVQFMREDTGTWNILWEMF